MGETFGQYLARRREAAGLSQAELAGRVGVTPTYIGYLERGDDPTGIGDAMRPVVEVVDAIAEALDTPVAEARCAAGYEPPEDSPCTCAAVESTFGESDFATLHRMYEKLSPERRQVFRPILGMLWREIESALERQDAGVGRTARRALPADSIGDGVPGAGQDSGT